MRKLLLTALVLAPLAMTGAALGATTDCGYAYGYSSPCTPSMEPAPSAEEQLYNQDIRIAAGDLQIKMSSLANAATGFFGQRLGARDVERGADKAAMEAWNFKQIAGVSSSRDYLIAKLAELQVHIDAIRDTFQRSGLAQERLTIDAFNAATASWDKLSSLVNALPGAPASPEAPPVR